MKLDTACWTANRSLFCAGGASSQQVGIFKNGHILAVSAKACPCTFSFANSRYSSGRGWVLPGMQSPTRQSIKEHAAPFITAFLCQMVVRVLRRSAKLFTAWPSQGAMLL